MLSGCFLSQRATPGQRPDWPSRRSPLKSARVHYRLLIIAIGMAHTIGIIIAPWCDFSGTFVFADPKSVARQIKVKRPCKSEKRRRGLWQKPDHGFQIVAPFHSVTLKWHLRMVFSAADYNNFVSNPLYEIDDRSRTGLFAPMPQLLPISLLRNIALIGCLIPVARDSGAFFIPSNYVWMQHADSTN